MGILSKTYRLGMQHQHTPRDMPKYNGVVEPWIGLLREKTITLLGDLVKLGTTLLWTTGWLPECDRIIT